MTTTNLSTLQTAIVNEVAKGEISASSLMIELEYAGWLERGDDELLDYELDELARRGLLAQSETTGRWLVAGVPA